MDRGRRPPASARARRCATLAATVLLCGVAALTACAPTEPAVGAPVDSADLEVAFLQQRSDAAERGGSIRVTNTGDEAVAVGAVHLDDPRFTEPATRPIDRVTVIPGGVAIDIAISLPPVRCAPADPAPASSITLAVGASAEALDQTLVVPLDDPLGVLAPLHARECRAERLAETARIAVTGFTAAPSGPGSLEITVLATGRGDAAVTQIDSTVLLSFADEGGRPLTHRALDLDLDAEGSTALVLPIVPARCDAHVIQEDKRGTIFTLEVHVDGTRGPVEIAAGEQMRGEILTWVSERCGLTHAG